MDRFRATCENLKQSLFSIMSFGCINFNERNKNTMEHIKPVEDPHQRDTHKETLEKIFTISSQKGDLQQFMQNSITIGKNLTDEQVRRLQEQAEKSDPGNLSREEALHFQVTYVRLLSFSYGIHEKKGKSPEFLEKEKACLEKQVEACVDLLVKMRIPKEDAKQRVEQEKKKFIALGKKDEQIRDDSDKRAMNLLDLTRRSLIYGQVAEIGTKPYPQGDKEQNEYLKAARNLWKTTVKLKIEPPRDLPYFGTPETSARIPERDPLWVQSQIGEKAEILHRACQEEKDYVTNYQELKSFVEWTVETPCQNIKKYEQIIPKQHFVEGRQARLRLEALCSEIQARTWDEENQAVISANDVTISSEEINNYIKQIDQLTQEIKDASTLTVRDAVPRIEEVKQQVEIAQENVKKVLHYLQLTKHWKMFEKWNASGDYASTMEEEKSEQLERIKLETEAFINKWSVCFQGIFQKFESCEQLFQSMSQGNFFGELLLKNNLFQINGHLDQYSKNMAEFLPQVSSDDRENMYQTGENSDPNFFRVTQAMGKLSQELSKVSYQNIDCTNQKINNNLDKLLKYSEDSDGKSINYFIVRAIKGAKQDISRKLMIVEFLGHLVDLEEKKPNKPESQPVQYPSEWASPNWRERPQEWSFLPLTDLLQSRKAEGKYTVVEEPIVDKQKLINDILEKIKTVLSDRNFTQVTCSLHQFYYELGKKPVEENYREVADKKHWLRTEEDWQAARDMLALCQLEYERAELMYGLWLQKNGLNPLGDAEKQAMAAMKSFVEECQANLVNLLAREMNMRVPYIGSSECDPSILYQERNAWQKEPGEPNWTKESAKAEVEKNGLKWRSFGQNGVKDDNDRRFFFLHLVAGMCYLTAQTSTELAPLEAQQESKELSAMLSESQEEVINSKSSDLQGLRNTNKKAQKWLNMFNQLGNYHCISEEKIELQKQLITSCFDEYAKKCQEEDPNLQNISDIDYNLQILPLKFEALRPLDELKKDMANGYTITWDTYGKLLEKFQKKGEEIIQNGLRDISKELQNNTFYMSRPASPNSDQDIAQNY